MTYQPQPATTSYWIFPSHKVGKQGRARASMWLKYWTLSLLSQPQVSYQHNSEQNVEVLLCGSPSSTTHTHTHMCARASARERTHTHETCPFLTFVYRQLQEWEKGISHYPLSRACLYTSPPADPSQAALALLSALFHICRGSHRSEASQRLNMTSRLHSRASLE